MTRARTPFPSPQVGSELQVRPAAPVRKFGFHPLKSGRNCVIGTRNLRCWDSFHPLKSGRNPGAVAGIACPAACFHPLKSGRNSTVISTPFVRFGVSIPSSRVGTSRGESGVGCGSVSIPSSRVGTYLLCTVDRCDSSVSIPSSRVGTCRSAR